MIRHALRLRRKSIALVLVGAFAGSVLTVCTAVAYQPFMVNARQDLYGARAQLLRARPNKRGHRVAALNLINQAIGQVNAGIAISQY